MSRPPCATLQLRSMPTCPSWAPALPFSLPADPDRPWCQVYEVQDGDTITSVAALFNITEEDLVDLNAGGWRRRCRRHAAGGAGVAWVGVWLCWARRSAGGAGWQAVLACMMKCPPGFSATQSQPGWCVHEPAAYPCLLPCRLPGGWLGAALRRPVCAHARLVSACAQWPSPVPAPLMLPQAARRRRCGLRVCCAAWGLSLIHI